MRFFFSLLLLAFILLSLQTTIFSHIPLLPVKPDLTLIMVVYIAIFHDDTAGIFLAFFLGCLMDTFSGSITGMYALLRIGTFFLTKLAQQKLYLKSTLFYICLTTVLSFIDGLLVLFTVFVFSSVDTLWPFIFKFLFIQSILTGIVTPLIFFICNQTRLLVENH